ncbi:MAG TPA: dephospho-CoA kinase [Flavisolibacter sp.]|nr:dephospho-CoA kinase [Flavisolibacter sp.]
MLRIGLTGGIGSGKTTVAKIFELLNVPVYYADAASKRLYHTDAELMKNIKQHFGEDMYTNDQLNRSKLAAVVFSDAARLNLLNQLVHPPTLRDAEEWMKRQSAPYAIKEAALLFESGSAGGLDLIVGVSAPLSLRLKRVMDRDGVSREEVLRRTKNQIDEDMKMKLCDFIIRNNEQNLVIPQVLQLHESFLQLASDRK